MKVDKITLSLIILFFVIKSSLLYSQNSFFIENKGQVVDQNNKVVNAVLYTLTTNNYNVNFYKNHFTYEVFEIVESGVNINRIEVWPDLISKKSSIKAKGVVNEGYNFFQSNARFQNVKEYKELTYKNLWEGIDVVFFIVNNQLKYNYIVSPQAKDEIKLKIKGALPKVIDKQINYTTNETVLLQEDFPACYWEGEEEVSLLNKISLTTLGSDISISYPKNRAKNIVIDPVAYSEKQTSYYGGIHQDFAEDIALNSKKELIVAGYTLSLNNIATTGAYQQFIDNVDSYIAKFDSLGNRIWATYFGGNDFERSYSVSVDSYDNIILSGNTMSITGIATPGAFQATLQSTDDSFIAKFTDSGSLLWSTYFGGNNHDFINSVTTDNQGDIYFTGHTLSLDYPITAGAYLSSFSNTETAYFTKLSSNGQLLHSTYIGSGEGKGNEIVVGGDGIYIIGATKAVNQISFSNSYQNTLAGDWDGFLLKIDKNTYQPVLGTYFGGASEDKFNGVKLVDDKLYIVGYTNSITNIADPNSSQPVKSSYEDGMLIAFDTLGNKLWSTYVGANGTDYLASVDELNGDLWLVGSSTSTNYPVDSSAFQQVNKGGYDIIISKFTTTGSQLWSSYKGGASDDYAKSIRINNSSDFYICGNTGSNNNFSTANAHQVYFGGNAFDGFFSKICKPIYPTYLSENTDTISICMGDSVQINSTNPFSNYAWNNGNSTSGITIKESGNYYLETIDNYGCPGNSDTIFVEVFTDTVLLNYSSLFICNEDSVLLSVDSNYSSYLWNNMNPDNTQYIHNIGQNWCVVEDDNGCTFHSDTVVLQTSNQFQLINVLGTPIICSGGEVILYVNSSTLSNYNWSNLEQTPSININTPGDYWLIGINIEGCPVYSDTIEVIVSNFQNQNISLNISDTVNLCRGDSVLINVNENFISYEWQNGNTSENFISLEEGLVYVSVVDSNSCTSRSDTVVVLYFSEKEISILYSEQLEICEGDSIQLVASDSLLQVEWYSGLHSQNIWIQTSDLIYYNALDSNGCLLFSDTIGLVVFQEQNYLIEVLQNSTYCDNLPLILKGFSDSSSWNNSFFNDSLFVFDSGDYFYSIIDTVTGCQWFSDTLSVQFIEPNMSKIKIDKNSICLGDVVTLQQEQISDFNLLIWDSLETTNEYSFILDSSRYVHLTMEDNNHCLVYDSLLVEGYECIESFQVFPNPSTDFITVLSPYLIQDYKIFNDLGQVVNEGLGINSTEIILDVRKLNVGLYNVVFLGGNIKSAILIEVIR